MALATAPNTTTYLSRTPYLTVAEYQNAPTAVDTTQLIPGGSAQANVTELANVLARASSWVDSICHQVLAATLDTDLPRRRRVNRYGYVRVPLRFIPVLEVDSVLVGAVPSQLTPISDGADIVFSGEGIIDVPVWATAPTVSPTFTPAQWDRPLVQVTYVNGWPNTLLSGPVNVGATLLPVVSALGVYAGTTLTVYDGAATEQVSVSQVNGTTLTVGPLLYAHAAGVSVSALPPAVKQATISLTSALIKTRGVTAVVMGAIGGEPTRTARTDGGGDEDVTTAESLLEPYVRQV